MFDPGGSTDRLRACPFLGTWRALLCGEVLVWAPGGDDLKCFWQMHDSEHHLPKEKTGDLYILRLIAVSPQSQADTWSRQVRRNTVMGGGRMNGCQEAP